MQMKDVTYVRNLRIVFYIAFSFLPSHNMHIYLPSRPPIFDAIHKILVSLVTKRSLFRMRPQLHHRVRAPYLAAAIRRRHHPRALERRRRHGRSGGGRRHPLPGGEGGRGGGDGRGGGGGGGGV